MRFWEGPFFNYFYRHFIWFRTFWGFWPKLLIPFSFAWLLLLFEFHNGKKLPISFENRRDDYDFISKCPMFSDKKRDKL